MKVVTAGGETITLGTTQVAPIIGIHDYSHRTTDDFGVTTVVERAFSRRMSLRFAVPFDQVDTVQRRMAELRATSALWVADDRFASLSVQGFYKDFAIDLSVPPTSFCSLTVEGLAESGSFTETGADPAPTGSASTLRLLQPATISGAALVSSTVPETDHPAWSAVTIYPLGARVIKTATHRIYESAVAGNVGNDPATTPQWVEVGTTSRWAMFDEALGTATTAGSTIAVTLSAGAAQAVALLDVNAATVRVQTTGYDRTVTVANRSAMFLDLPGSSANVTVTIAGTGQLSVGSLLIGRLVTLGITEASPTAGITDYSRKQADEFGQVEVVERAWAKRMEARSLIRTDAIDLVAGRIASVRAQPSLWIGESGLETLTVYGFFKDFSIEVGEAVSKLSLSVEGLSTAGKVEPLKFPVDWSEVRDPDGTKPSDNADVTGENTAKDTTNVGGVPATRIISDRLATADTQILQTLNSYSQRQRVIAQLYLNGVPVRAIAQILTEARVDEQGNAFARAGLEVDANGVIGGLFITSNGAFAEFKIGADKLIMVRPGTDGSDPDDVLLSVVGNKTILHDVEVDSIKVGTITPAEMEDGAVGQGGMSFDSGAVTVTSQTTWTQIASATLTPAYGKPLKIDFNAFAECTNAESTRLYLRVVRDDGTSIYGGTSGRQIRVNDEGDPLSIRCFDGSVIGRPTTYTLQAKKSVNSEAVAFHERVALIEELSRVFFQNFLVATSSPDAGPTAGTGGGTGGGGEPYDPNPWPYHQFNP